MAAKGGFLEAAHVTLVDPVVFFFFSLADAGFPSPHVFSFPISRFEMDQWNQPGIAQPRQHRADAGQDQSFSFENLMQIRLADGRYLAAGSVGFCSPMVA